MHPEAPRGRWYVVTAGDTLDGIARQAGVPAEDILEVNGLSRTEEVTAGRLIFGADAGGNFVARDVATGKPLWHARLGNISNAAETYMLDGRQYVILAAGDSLYSFAVNP